ncbi:MAG: carboxypeptidase-like regulatory domain-containing protein, partial [Kofleriaceae bacterium]
MALVRIIVALAVIAWAPSLAFADRTVRGTVRDGATGDPIEGALVTVGIGEATTAADGTFTVGDVPFGRVDVLVIADDYATYFGSARVGQVLAIRLDSEAHASEVIHVSGHAPSGPPLHLDTQAIRTQPGAGNDVLRALQSLPGAARTPFGMGGL